MALATTFLESGGDATQDLTFYATNSGTVTAATDQSHTGSYSIKCNSGAGAVTALVSTKTGILADSGSQISFYFRFDVLPSANETFCFINDSSNIVVLKTRLGPSGVIVNSPQGATAATGTKILAVNTWYRICISYYITNTTTYQCKVYVNGVLDSTTNAGTLIRTGTNRLMLQIEGTAGANKNHWFDDIYCATGGADSSAQPDTGDIRVTAKRPNANGTTNGFTTQIGSGGSGYGSGHSPQVNEQPLSTTNGWSMIGAGSAITEEYTIEGLTVGNVDLTGYSILDFMGWVYAKSLSSETGSIVVAGATSSISLTSTNTLFIKAAGSTVYPAGGTDIGIVTDTTLTTVSLYECGILVAFSKPVGKLYSYPSNAAQRASTY